VGVACLNTCNACATRGAIGEAYIKLNKNNWISIVVRRGVAALTDGFDGKPSTLVEAADSRQGEKRVLTAKDAKERQGQNVYLRVDVNQTRDSCLRTFAERVSSWFSFALLRVLRGKSLSTLQAQSHHQGRIRLSNLAARALRAVATA